jgi:glutathione S-transferase
MVQALKVIGGHESYFTGKLESYLRAKGIAYENMPFTMEGLQEVAAQTGFFQIPQVQGPDGGWLVDTTSTIEYLDRLHPEPSTSPTDPAANFIALLLEDYADEWLWRPAMHYRWSFKDGAELLSSWLAEHSPVTDLSLEETKAGWVARQKGTFVDGDGVTNETRSAVESSYQHALEALEVIFERRDFILGDRPTQADFGFMGPMFRHFFCDPDPARIMRDTAPGVHEWVARMWNMKPHRFASASEIQGIPDDLGYLLKPVLSAYLPYLMCNQQAVIAGHDQVHYEALDVAWTEPSKPFRLGCLDQLRKAYQALDDGARAQLAQVFNDSAAESILATPATGYAENLFPSLPIVETIEGRPVFDSWGRQS